MQILRAEMKANSPDRYLIANLFLLCGIASVSKKKVFQLGFNSEIAIVWEYAPLLLQPLRYEPTPFEKS